MEITAPFQLTRSHESSTREDNVVNTNHVQHMMVRLRHQPYYKIMFTQRQISTKEETTTISTTMRQKQDKAINEEKSKNLKERTFSKNGQTHTLC